MVCDMITLSVDQTSVILLHLPLRPEYNMCCVSRVKVMGAEEGGRAEAEREGGRPRSGGSPPALELRDLCCITAAIRPLTFVLGSV